MEAGTTYCYLLEEIEINGTFTKLENFIVCATVLGQVVTDTPTPTRTRTPTPTATHTPKEPTATDVVTKTPTPTLSADRTIYLPLLLRTN